MKINKLSILNFKNCQEADLNFNTKIICFTGLNGAGKTNLLDSIYYLSFCKSYFLNTDSQNIRKGNDFFVIQAQYTRNEQIEKIFCAVKQGKKKTFKRNDKEYQKLSEHIGLLPCVIISPADSVLIAGSGEDRRKFIDTVISQYDRKYLHSLIRYNRILAQRNKLLKGFAKKRTFDADFLDILSSQLSQYGQYIFEVRKAFIQKLLPIFNKYYNQISENKEQPSLKYKSQLHQASLPTLLTERIEKDRALQYTSAGTHRDDLSLILHDSPVKRSGSQGQQKTYLMALKLAQYEFLKDINGFKPVLLLDDIFDKFDAQRVGQITKLIQKDTFGQIFITDTHTDRLKLSLENAKADFKIYEVENGAIL